MKKLIIIISSLFVLTLLVASPSFATDQNSNGNAVYHSSDQIRSLSQNQCQGYLSTGNNCYSLEANYYGDSRNGPTDFSYCSAVKSVDSSLCQVAPPGLGNYYPNPNNSASPASIPNTTDENACWGFTGYTNRQGNFISCYRVREINGKCMVDDSPQGYLDISNCNNAVGITTPTNSSNNSPSQSNPSTNHGGRYQDITQGNTATSDIPSTTDQNQCLGVIANKNQNGQQFCYQVQILPDSTCGVNYRAPLDMSICNSAPYKNSSTSTTGSSSTSNSQPQPAGGNQIYIPDDIATYASSPARCGQISDTDIRNGCVQQIQQDCATPNKIGNNDHLYKYPEFDTCITGVVQNAESQAATVRSNVTSCTINSTGLNKWNLHLVNWPSEDYQVTVVNKSNNESLTGFPTASRHDVITDDTPVDLSSEPAGSTFHIQSGNDHALACVGDKTVASSAPVGGGPGSTGSNGGNSSSKTPLNTELQVTVDGSPDGGTFSPTDTINIGGLLFSSISQEGTPVTKNPINFKLDGNPLPSEDTKLVESGQPSSTALAGQTIQLTLSNLADGSDHTITAHFDGDSGLNLGPADSAPIRISISEKTKIETSTVMGVNGSTQPTIHPDTAVVVRPVVSANSNSTDQSEDCTIQDNVSVQIYESDGTNLTPVGSRFDVHNCQSVPIPEGINFEAGKKYLVDGNYNSGGATSSIYSPSGGHVSFTVSNSGPMATKTTIQIQKANGESAKKPSPNSNVAGVSTTLAQATSGQQPQADNHITVTVCSSPVEGPNTIKSVNLSIVSFNGQSNGYVDKTIENCHPITINPSDQEYRVGGACPTYFHITGSTAGTNDFETSWDRKDINVTCDGQSSSTTPPASSIPPVLTGVYGSSLSTDRSVVFTAIADYSLSQGTFKISTDGNNSAEQGQTCTNNNNCQELRKYNLPGHIYQVKFCANDNLCSNTIVYNADTDRFSQGDPGTNGSAQAASCSISGRLVSEENNQQTVEFTVTSDLIATSTNTIGVYDSTATAINPSPIGDQSNLGIAKISENRNGNQYVITSRGNFRQDALQGEEAYAGIFQGDSKLCRTSNIALDPILGPAPAPHIEYALFDGDQQLSDEIDLNGITSPVSYTIKVKVNGQFDESQTKTITLEPEDQPTQDQNNQGDNQGSNDSGNGSGQNTCDYLHQVIGTFTNQDSCTTTADNGGGNLVNNQNSTTSCDPNDLNQWDVQECTGANGDLNVYTCPNSEQDPLVRYNDGCNQPTGNGDTGSDSGSSQGDNTDTGNSNNYCDSYDTDHYTPIEGPQGCVYAGQREYTCNEDSSRTWWQEDSSCTEDYTDPSSNYNPNDYQNNGQDQSGYNDNTNTPPDNPDQTDQNPDQ